MSKKSILYIIYNLDKITLKEVEIFKKYMPPERIKKCEKFLDLNKKKIYIASYFFLWQLLKKNKICSNHPSFKYNHFKKPRLWFTKKICFNISHTNNTIFLAISDEPVGVDAEKIKNVPQKLIEKICTKNELKLIDSSCDYFKSFFYIWTKKESFVKKNGNSIFLNYAKLDTTNLKNIFSFSFKDLIYSLSFNHHKKFKTKKLDATLFFNKLKK